MSIIWKTSKIQLLCLAIFACLLVGATTSAFGVPANQTLRVVTPQTFRGICCFSWFESVSVSEPATPVPVAITWSVDYTDSVGEFVGLSVNGGACQFYGSSSLYASETNRGAMTRTFNWIVFPTDGPASIALHKGTNTFTLCGGGMFFAEQSVTLLNNTLSARTAQ